MLERTTEPAPKPQVAAPAPAATRPTAVRPASRLQSRAGNHAFVDLLGEAGIQAKLLVGAVHDPEEVEADRIADRVLRSLGSAPPTPPPDAPADDVGHVSRRFRRRAEMARRHAQGSSDPAPPVASPEPPRELPAMVATTETGPRLNREAFANPSDVFELRRTEVPTVRRFMKAADFAQLTYQSRFTRRSTAQAAIDGWLKQYARLKGTWSIGIDRERYAVDVDQSDAALKLLDAMIQAAEAYITNKSTVVGGGEDGGGTARKDKKTAVLGEDRNKRFAGFETFVAAARAERDQVLIRKRDLESVGYGEQAPVKVDTSGLQKVVDNYTGDLGTCLSLAAMAMASLCSANGDMGELTATVKIPIPPAFFVGGKLAITGSRDNDLTTVKMNATFIGGVDVGIADVNAGLGGYFKAAGKDARTAMKLLSYGMYRKCKESPVFPAGVASAIWGADNDATGDEWSLRVERDELETDQRAYVEAGGVAEVGASASVGVASAEAGGSVSAGKRWDKASLEATKGGAGNENTAESWSQKQTASDTWSRSASASASVSLPGAAGMAVACTRETSAVAGAETTHWEVRGNTTFPAAGFGGRVAVAATTFALWIKDRALAETELDAKGAATAAVTKGMPIASATTEGLDGVGFTEWCQQKIADPEASPSAAREGGAEDPRGATVGVEFAYVHDQKAGGEPTATYEVRQLVATSAKVPMILQASLSKRKRIVGARNAGGAGWTLIA